MFEVAKRTWTTAWRDTLGGSIRARADGAGSRRTDKIGRGRVSRPAGDVRARGQLLARVERAQTVGLFGHGGKRHEAHVVEIDLEPDADLARDPLPLPDKKFRSRQYYPRGQPQRRHRDLVLHYHQHAAGFSRRWSSSPHSRSRARQGHRGDGETRGLVAFLGTGSRAR